MILIVALVAFFFALWVCSTAMGAARSQEVPAQDDMEVLVEAPPQELLEGIPFRFHSGGKQYLAEPGSAMYQRIVSSLEKENDRE